VYLGIKPNQSHAAGVTAVSLKGSTMKTTIIALLMTTAPVFAGPTENITGCATMAVEGSNYTVRVDANCALATNKANGDADSLMLEALAVVAAN
jgi:hypothetical protein